MACSLQQGPLNLDGKRLHLESKYLAQSGCEAPLKWLRFAYQTADGASYPVLEQGQISDHPQALCRLTDTQPPFDGVKTTLLAKGMFQGITFHNVALDRRESAVLYTPKDPSKAVQVPGNGSLVSVWTSTK